MFALDVVGCTTATKGREQSEMRVQPHNKCERTISGSRRPISPVMLVSLSQSACVSGSERRGWATCVRGLLSMVTTSDVFGGASDKMYGPRD